MMASVQWLVALLAIYLAWKLLVHVHIIWRCWRGGVPVVLRSPWSTQRAAWEKEQQNKLAFCLEYHKRFGSVVMVNPFPVPRVLVSEPEIVKQIFVLDRAGFPKTDLASLFLGRIMGPNSIFLEEGESHKRTRRLLAPAFSTTVLQAMAPEMACVSLQIMEDWGLCREKPSGVVSIVRSMQHLALLTLFRTMLGMETGGESLGDAAKGGTVGGPGRRGELGSLQAEYSPLLKELLSLEFSLARVLLRRGKGRGSWKDLVPLPSTLASGRKLRRLDELCMRMFDMARGKETGKSSPLGILLGMDSNKGTPAKLSDTAIRDQVVTFILAGHETTALMLSWTLLLLAQHPDWQAEVRRQVLDICGNCVGGGSVRDCMGFEKINRLTKLTMTLFESLRLFPPAPIISRLTKDDKTFVMDNGTSITIPRGAYAVVDILSMHKDPRFWPESPEEFNPKRWESRLRGSIFAGPRLGEGQHPFSFFPFGAGQRGCIGNNFSLLEGHVALACMLQRFTFSVPKDAPPVYADHMVTLFPKDHRLDLKVELM